MTTAYLNRVATAVPRHDVHAPFERHILAALADDRRRSRVFQRMTERSGIEHRYSCISPDNLSIGGFYAPGAFPDTAARMRAFERHAPAIACAAVERLLGNSERRRITHLLTTCCTGFSAPGLDYDVIEHCDLPRDVERTMVGFMGCYAAINALKLARHIVRSEPEARVLMLNIELCTLHLQETGDLEQMIWNVPEIIWQLSQQVELQAGDIIMTGTPAGVSQLQPGDKIECGCDGVGTLTVTIGKPA